MNDARQLPPHLTAIADTLTINNQAQSAEIVRLAADAITSLTAHLDTTRRKHLEALTATHKAEERTAEVIRAWETCRDQLAATRHNQPETSA